MESLRYNNYPVAKAGLVASLPGEAFKLRLVSQNRTNGMVPVDFEGKIFLVDGLIVGGNSGGPVIMPTDFKIWAEKGQLKWLEGTENSVIGVVSQVGPSGLSVVFSSDYVLDLMGV